MSETPDAGRTEGTAAPAAEAPPSDALGWETRASTFVPLLKAAWALAARPKATWKDVPRGGGWADPTLFAVLAGLADVAVYAGAAAVVVQDEVRHASGNPSRFWAACAAALAVATAWTLLALAGGALTSAVERWLLRRSGATPTWGEVYRLWGYSQAPALFSPVTSVVGACFVPGLTSLWQRWSRARAYEAHYGLGLRRAAFVALAPLAAFVLLAALGLGAAIAIDELT